MAKSSTRMVEHTGFKVTYVVVLGSLFMNAWFVWRLDNGIVGLMKLWPSKKEYSIILYIVIMYMKKKPKWKYFNKGDPF